ncbi:MAG: PhoU domain-containing protein, partial [Blautia sp.]
MKNAVFSAQAVNELHIMEKAVNDIVEKAYTVFATQDIRLAEEIEPLEEVIDELSRELKRRHIN